MPSHTNKPMSGGEGQPNGVYLAKTLMERSPICRCSWVWSHEYHAYLLKYRQTLCPATAFHRKLGG